MYIYTYLYAYIRFYGLVCNVTHISLLAQMHEGRALTNSFYAPPAAASFASLHYWCCSRNAGKGHAYRSNRGSLTQ